MPSTTNTVSVQ